MAIIKIKRGLKANIPTLEVGEPGFCTDTKELFVGSSDGNKLVGEGTFLKLSGGTLTGALTLPSTAPTSATHAVTKAYVDNVASGLDVKASVKCVATVNQLLSTGGDHSEYEYTNNNAVIIDGYTVEEGDRILLVGQSNHLQNGIFVVTKVGDGTNPCSIERPEDATDGTLTGGAFVFVEKGTTYADTGWVCTTDDDPLVIGSTLIEFTQFTGAGSSSFVALADTPSSYTNQGGKSVRVKSNEGGLEFVSPTFLNLDDTPTVFTGAGGYLVRVKSNASGLEFVDSTTVGRTKFKDLDDTPSAYDNGKIVVSGSAGITFADNKVFGGLFSDVPSTMGAQNKTLLSNGTALSFVDFKLTSLVDCPSTMGAQYQMLAVGSQDKLEFIGVDGTPGSNHRNPISSDWAYNHNAADTNVHGAPAGSNLLHESSTIDGGTF